MILIKQSEVFEPEKMGIKDILVGGGKILAMEDQINGGIIPELNVISAKGLLMIPGLIDGHVHIAGAGGEGGPATRTPEMQLHQMLEGGITTVVGCLGTDGFTRSVESVLMKAKNIRNQGLSAWIYTGAYQVPPPTILGDAGKDIALIEEVIGVGEIAISDHRSSNPTVQDLIHLAEHARVGGMLGNKAGIVNFHMGNARNPFDILFDVVENSELHFTQFLPTHCNRNTHIFNDAKEYGKKGYIDITASSYPYFPRIEKKPSRAIVELCQAGVPLEHITLSSDGCGSLPYFDEKGNLIRINSGEPKSIFVELVDLVKQENWPLEKALKVVTTNVADILKLNQKGRIQNGKDADLVLLNQDFEICHLVVNGELMIKDTQQIKNLNFEK